MRRYRKKRKPAPGAQDLSALSYNELRAAAKAAGINSFAKSKAELIQELS